MFPFLSCEPPTPVSNIEISITQDNSNVNMDTLGGEDYIIHRQDITLPSGYRKTGGGSLITVTEVFGAGFGSYSEQKQVEFTASDSTPSFSGVTKFVRTLVDFDGSTANGGFNIILPANIGVRTAKIYIYPYAGGAGHNFIASASFSDSSASNFVNFLSGGGSTIPYVIDIKYSCATEGHTLNVYVGTNGNTTGTAVAMIYAATWVSKAS